MNKLTICELCKQIIDWTNVKSDWTKNMNKDKKRTNKE